MAIWSSRLQLTVLLSAPTTTSPGGEFLLASSARAPSHGGEVVPLRQGEAVIFPVHHRPVERDARPLPGNNAPWGEPSPFRPALHPRDHLPRRSVTKGGNRGDPVAPDSRFRTKGKNFLA